MNKLQKQIYVFIGIVKNNKGELLVIKRDEKILSDAHNKWEFPGGKIKFGESPQEALEREIKEETGYEVEVLSLLPDPFVYFWNYPNHYQHTIVLAFKCKLKKNRKLSKRIVDDHHVKDIRWCFPNELKQLKLLPGVTHFLSQI